MYFTSTPTAYMQQHQSNQVSLDDTPSTCILLLFLVELGNSLKISDVRSSDIQVKKIPMSDTESDVYRCEVRYIFCTVYVCNVLFWIDVTTVRRIINAFFCHPGMKLSTMQLYHMGRVTHIDCRNNDYINHISPCPSAVCQTCSHALVTWTQDSGLCGSLNARHRVTITYRHTDATDSLMFRLSPMLLISDIRCANRPNSRTY